MATPELLQDIELPSSISVLGQPVDLTNLKVDTNSHNRVTVLNHLWLF